MRKLLMVGTAAMLLGATSAPTSAWTDPTWTNPVCTTTLSSNICLGFSLQGVSPGNFTLTVAWQNTGPGQITGIGLYYYPPCLDIHNNPTPCITDANVVTMPPGWTTPSNGVSALGTVFEVTAGRTGQALGITQPGSAVITFTSTQLFGMSSSTLYARAHVQSIPDEDPFDDETTCSLKLDNRLGGAVGGEGNCTGTVPEPVSLVLLGSGLLGLGGLRMRRRNRK